jgi:predicted MFS family arabinose efflux permease
VANATLPALLLYIVIYLQDILGYNALQTGERLMVISAGIVVFGGLAGRLSGRAPARLLLALGLSAIGAGLVLMRGLGAGSGWTALIPGLVVAGGGMGLVNPTLASLAVDVVAENRSGMGAGINNTFRQVGVATGIAGLGSIFQHRVIEAATAAFGQVPALRPQAHEIAQTLASGHGTQGIHALPGGVRAGAVHAARTAFTSGLNEVFLVAAIVGFTGALVALIAVRQRDFVRHEQSQSHGEVASQPAAATVLH